MESKNRWEAGNLYTQEWGLTVTAGHQVRDVVPWPHSDFAIALRAGGLVVRTVAGLRQRDVASRRVTRIAGKIEPQLAPPS